MLVPPPLLRLPRRRPRTRVLLAAAGVATALHAWLLLPDPSPPPVVGATPAAPPVQVRTLDDTLPEAPATLAGMEPAPPLAMAPALRPAAATPAKRGPPLSPVKSEAPVEEPLPAAPTVGAADVPELVKVAATVAATGPADEAPPVYRTRLPSAATLHYTMQRGMFSGTGELQWKPAGERYELRLEGRVAGVSVLTETSSGLIDEHGLAPLRFTDTRIRRGTSAANFQREKGKITFSGPQTEYPLLPGSQDRLAWMLQIAAVLNAQPQHAALGGRVAFLVVGAHGDADVWVFRYVGAEQVSTGAGLLAAVKFTREPRKPYDRSVEVWLAPARQHLPVRARFTTSANGEVFELLLRDMHAQ